MYVLKSLYFANARFFKPTSCIVLRQQIKHKSGHQAWWFSQDSISVSSLINSSDLLYYFKNLKKQS